MYGKSLQQDGGVINPSNRTGAEKSHICQESDDLQDPSLHPWGGLVGTRDGMLTLLDSFIHGKSLRPIQNVRWKNSLEIHFFFLVINTDFSN